MLHQSINISLSLQATRWCEITVLADAVSLHRKKSQEVQYFLASQWCRRVHV